MPVLSVLERLWYYLSFTQLSLWHLPQARSCERNVRVMQTRTCRTSSSENRQP
jgi:hypothetical protein